MQNAYINSFVGGLESNSHNYHLRWLFETKSQQRGNKRLQLCLQRHSYQLKYFNFSEDHFT